MQHLNKLLGLSFGLALLTSHTVQAQQGIGTGSTPPRTTLDVNGPTAAYETTATLSGASPAYVVPAVGQVQLSGAPTGIISLTTAAAITGQRLVVYNNTGVPATLNSQNIPAAQAVEFIYSASGWRASAGGGNSVTANNGLTKTGQNIALGGTLTGATTIAQAGNAFSLTGGNVGIGTTAPTQALDVRGNIRLGDNVSSTGSGSAVEFIGPGINSDPIGFYRSNISSNVSELRLVLGDDPNRGAFGDRFVLGTTSQSSPDQLMTGGFSPKFTVLSDGGVGIGTTAPAAQLDIQGGADANGANDPVALAFSFRSGGYRHFLRSRHNTALNGGNSLDFYLNNSNTGTGSSAPGTGNIQVLTLDNNGGPRVGIGTTTPAQTLEVAGTAGTANVRLGSLAGTGVRVVTASATGDLSTGTAASIGALTTADNGLTATGTNVQLGGTLIQPTTIAQGTNDMTFTGGGFLAKYSSGATANSGILLGRTGVDGAVGVAGSTGQFYNGAQAGDMINEAITGSLFMGTVGAFPTWLGSNNVLRMVVSAAGNIGIATPNPRTLFSISPTLYEAKITLFDGGSTTAHYGFGVTANQLNYDAPASTSHVFYSGGKNGTGTELARINSAGLDLAGALNVGTGATVGAGLSVTGATSIRSGLAATPATLVFGRTSNEGSMGISSGPGAFFPNTVAGDMALGAVTTRLVIGTATANPLIFDTNSAEQMRILASGFVGIGNNAPAYRLDVTGDINASGNVRAAGVALTSDRRLKRNITPTAFGLATVMSLKPVQYEKKASIASTDYSRHEIGFIAQEVQQLIPSIVTEGQDANKTLAVSYTELIPVLTKAIQEQQAQIEALKAANAKLTTANASLQTSLDGKASASTLSALQADLQTLRSEMLALKAAGSTASSK